jgi:hypothetical protein
MDTKFLNARSPMRLLEKGLHGGLGAGNLGLVIAGPGVGKTAFLVGVGLDSLLRGEHILHVSLDHTVSHVRTYYDTLFEDLASSAHLEDEAVTHAEIDRRRSIRAYPRASFSAGKLREAVKIESEAGARPTLVIVEGFEFAGAAPGELADFKALAEELGAEMWHSVGSDEEHVSALPSVVAPAADVISVIVALEPDGDHVALRALKDHDNPDLSALHVHLDPRTLLLVRG